MDEYKVTFPRPEITDKTDRDKHHDALEELLQEILDEQQRAFQQWKSLEK